MFQLQGQYICLSCWNNIPINQSDLKEKFAVYVKFRVTTSADWVLRHQCYSPFPSDFRDILWDGCACVCVCVFSHLTLLLKDTLSSLTSLLYLIDVHLLQPLTVQ